MKLVKLDRRYLLGKRGFIHGLLFVGWDEHHDYTSALQKANRMFGPDDFDSEGFRRSRRRRYHQGWQHMLAFREEKVREQFIMMRELARPE